MTHSHALPQKADRSISSGARFLKKSRTGTCEFARAEPDRFVVVDGLLEKEEIADFVADAIRQMVATGRKPKKK